MSRSAFTNVVKERKRVADEPKIDDDRLKEKIKLLSPKSRRKELNKIYCRNRRRNQKDYILGLENRINELEAEVAKLQAIVRDKIPLFSGSSIVTSRTVKTKEFKLMENDRSLKIIDNLKEEYDGEKIQSSLNKINKSFGTASDPRKNIINSAVRDIINNMISPRTRVLLRMIDKGTDANMDDYKRLFLMNIEDFEREMKNSKYGPIDRMHYIMQTDPSKMPFIRQVEVELYEYKHKFQDLIHDLIKLRNKIFNTQAEFKKIDNPKKAGLEPRNVAKFLELSKPLETDEDYSIYKLFKINKKKPVSKRIYIESTEMSDVYDEEEIALTDTDMEAEGKIDNGNEKSS